MLKQTIANTLLQSVNPIDSLQGLTDQFARERYRNPGQYVEFVKTAVSLLGEDYILHAFKDNCKMRNVVEIQVLEKLASDQPVNRENVLNYIYDPSQEGFYKLLKFARSDMNMRILALRSQLRKVANINSLVN